MSLFTLSNLDGSRNSLMPLTLVGYHIVSTFAQKHRYGDLTNPKLDPLSTLQFSLI